MAKKQRVTVDSKAIGRILKGPQVKAEVEKRTTAIREACNADSSWGGYYSHVYDEYSRPLGRIWTIGRYDSEGTDRALRMLKKLDAGRF